MIRTALKGVAAHRLRLALTTLAVVLGVAFVAGTYVFTDSIQARFETLFDDVYAGVDATVRPVPPEFGFEQRSMPESVLDQVVATEGVAAAAPSVGGFAQVIGSDGEPVGVQGPPTFGFSWISEPALNPFRIADGDGRAPGGPGEVVLDAATAETAGFSVGEQIQIQLPGGMETFELVGIASFGDENNLAGATISVFELSEAQRVLGLTGLYSQIDVLAADGIEAEELLASLASGLPEGMEVVTGEQQTAEQLESFTSELGFLTTALLAFAGVAVLVGAFIIQNTFRIIVAQRTRELALLRAVGATGRQVMVMVVIEALVVAVAASALGVLAGVGLAELLKAGMDAVGFGPPEGPLTVAPRTVVVAVTVGVVVTLFSALLPARAASRVAPVAAMREAAAGPQQRSLRRRAASGAALTLLGGVALAAGIFGGNGLVLVAAGALGVFLGVSVLAPLFARPVASILGRPLPGVVGLLARENTRREPRRTAATASALMVGVALVAFVSIFAASIKTSVAEALEGAFPADLALVSTSFYTGVPDAAIEAWQQVDELAVVSVVRGGQVQVEGEGSALLAVDPATIDRVYSLGASIETDEIGAGMLVHVDLLAERGWQVGQTIEVHYASGGRVPTEIAGSFEDRTFGTVAVTHDTYHANFTGDEALVALARVVPELSVEEAKAIAEAAVASFPSLDVNTRSDQIAQAEAQVDALLVLFTGLLGLAVLIAVMGIANTLALSVVERTREIGLLRAVGATRRQVRRMVRGEAVITALFGAVLGIGLGSVLGWAVVAGLADQGLGSFTLPGAQLAVWLGVSAVAGVVAAIFPARKASRLDILQAIAYE